MFVWPHAKVVLRPGDCLATQNDILAEVGRGRTALDNFGDLYTLLPTGGNPVGNYHLGRRFRSDKHKYICGWQAKLRCVLGDVDADKCRTYLRRKRRNNTICIPFCKCSKNTPNGGIPGNDKCRFNCTFSVPALVNTSPISHAYLNQFRVSTFTLNYDIKQRRNVTDGIRNPFALVGVNVAPSGGFLQLGSALFHICGISLQGCGALNRQRGILPSFGCAGIRFCNTLFRLAAKFFLGSAYSPGEIFRPILL